VPYSLAGLGGEAVPSIHLLAALHARSACNAAKTKSGVQAQPQTVLAPRWDEEDS